VRSGLLLMPHIRDVFEMTVSYLCTKGAASGAAAVASGAPPPAQQQQQLRDEAVLLHKALVNLDADSVWLDLVVRRSTRKQACCKLSCDSVRLDLVVRGSTCHAKCGFKKSCLFKVLCTSMH
jgi:hypothetical protein